MADPRVRIIVDAVTDAAERKMRQLKGTVEETGKSAEKSGGMFDGFEKTIGKLAAGIGVAAVAFGTLKKTYDFAKEGAAIGQTRASFDRLMASMGVAPDILRRLQDASRGTVDDMTIMSSTLTLLAGTSEDLGKAMMDAAPQLMEIAKAAHKLNPAAGDVEYFYNSVATGIKRSSPLILDNLGLVIKVGDANEAMAAKLGKSVDALSAEEKQMALLNAVLESGDRMIQQVGGSVDEMGDSFARLETQVKNTTDEAKAGFADIFLGAGETANQLVIMTNAGLKWVGAAITGKDATRAFNDEMLNQVGIMNVISDETKRVSDKWQTYADALKEAQGPTRDLSQDTEDLAGNVELVAQMMSDRAARAADDFKGSLDNLHAAISGEVGEAFLDYTTTVEGLTSKLEGLREKEAELSKQPLVSTSQQDRLVDLRDDIAKTTGKLGEAKEAYAKLLAEGADAEDLEKAQGNIDKWQGKLDELNTTVSRTWRDINSATKEELADVREGIEETTAAIEAESDAFARNTRELAFNIAEKQILDALEKDLIEDVNNSGTAYDEATEMLWALAEQLGLTDEATIQFMEGVQDATEAVITGDSTTDAWTQKLDILSGRAGTVRGDLATMADEIRNLPQFKEIVIEYKTKYTSTGTPPPVVLTEEQQESKNIKELAMQHGGQFVVRGRAGIDKVPVGFMATRGEVVTVTPVGGVPPPNPVTNHYNLSVTSTQSSMGIQKDFYMMQALQG